MNIFQALLLGLVQGLAEFLPISSSGHLVLLREVMGISGDFLLFDTLMHVATLFAIFLVFFKDLIGLFKPPFKTMGLIILASIPAVLVGFLLQDKIETLFSNGKYLCFFFLGSAIIMLAAEIIGKRVKEPKPLGIKTAIFMGIMQGVAVFPGITRSGSTIFGGVVSGTERSQVAKFSFFMSIPVILGATLLQLIKLPGGGGEAIAWYCYAGGMLVAFVSGLLAIKLMLKLIAKVNFKWFSLYLFVISILSFLFLFLRIAG